MSEAEYDRMLDAVGAAVAFAAERQFLAANDNRVPGRFFHFLTTGTPSAAAGYSISMRLADSAIQ